MIAGTKQRKLAARRNCFKCFSKSSIRRRRAILPRCVTALTLTFARARARRPIRRTADRMQDRGQVQATWNERDPPDNTHQSSPVPSVPGTPCGLPRRAFHVDCAARDRSHRMPDSVSRLAAEAGFRFCASLPPCRTTSGHAKGFRASPASHPTAQDPTHLLRLKLGTRHHSGLDGSKPGFGHEIAVRRYRPVRKFGRLAFGFFDKRAAHAGYRCRIGLRRFSACSFGRRRGLLGRRLCRNAAP